MFAGKAGACDFGLERLARNKRSSLLWKVATYGRKKLIALATLACTINIIKFVVRNTLICRVTYDRNSYNASRAKNTLLEVQFKFIVMATAIMIVNYDCNMFLVQATSTCAI